jgi:hypothetical protein
MEGANAGSQRAEVGLLYAARTELENWFRRALCYKDGAPTELWRVTSLVDGNRSVLV